MKVIEQSLRFELQQIVKIGNISAQLTAEVITDSSFDEKTTDVEFMEIDNIYYDSEDPLGLIVGLDVTTNRLTPVKDWEAFKSFHLTLGIDYDQMLGEKFKEVFNKKMILTLCKNEFINTISF